MKSDMQQNIQANGLASDVHPDNANLNNTVVSSQPTALSSATAMGADVIFNGKDASVDIVFVHGLGTPWGGSERDWPRRVFPNLTKGRFITYSYAYDIQEFWSTDSGRHVQYHAVALLRQVNKLRSESKTSTRPLVLVAHSIGGLICQKALTMVASVSDDQKSLIKQVCCLMLIGTPSHTTEQDWAKAGEKLYQLDNVGPPTPREDPSKSQPLAKMVGDFIGLLEAKELDPFEVACFFEGLPTQRGGGEFIADEDAVKIAGCPIPTELRLTHEGMADFRDERHPNLKPLLDDIESLVDRVADAEEAENQTTSQNNFNITAKDNHGVMMGQGTLSHFYFGGVKGT